MSFALLVTNIVGFMNGVVVPLIFSLAALAFLFGIFKFFFLSNGDAKGQQQGTSFILWGLIALAVLFSTWGLVNMLLATFGLQSGI